MRAVSDRAIQDVLRRLECGETITPEQALEVLKSHRVLATELNRVEKDLHRLKAAVLSLRVESPETLQKAVAALQDYIYPAIQAEVSLHVQGAEVKP